MARGVRVSEAERSAVMRLWCMDVRVVEIVARTGVPRRTVNGIVAAAGMSRPFRMPPRRHTEADRDRALHLYASNDRWSCRDVAEIIGGGLSHSRVATWVRAAGLSRPPGRRRIVVGST